MLYADFANTPAGKLTPTVYGAQAFVPNSLPPGLTQSDLGALALNIADAMAAIGELRGASRRLQNPMILIRPLQRLEAQTSSAMEGTHTTADALALEEVGFSGARDENAREVGNYIRALKAALLALETTPLSGRLFKAAHRQLLDGVRGADKRPGEYKTDQNMIGGARIDSARFIPPPPREAEDAMADLERFLNGENRSGCGPLVDIALAHYQFETIHPFADGNGRVGRMLISLMAVKENLLEKPVLYMSPEIERRKDAYIDLMYQVSATGAWLEWIRFFLDVLGATCRRTVETIDELLILQDTYRARAAEASQSANLGRVVDMLFDSPVIRPRMIMDSVGVTDRAARQLLGKLSNAGMVEEIPDMQPKVWMAPQILNISRPR